MGFPLANYKRELVYCFWEGGNWDFLPSTMDGNFGNTGTLGIWDTGVAVRKAAGKLNFLHG